MKDQTEICRTIFEIPVDDYLHHEDNLARRLFQKATGNNFLLTIASLNPEILLKASTNSDFKKTVSIFDEKLIDGFGIQLVFFFKGWGKTKRLTGANLSWQLLNFAKKENLKVGAVVMKDGLSSRHDVEKFFKSKDLQYAIFEKDLQENDQIFIDKNSAELHLVEILFVFLGAPYQENFLEIVKKSIVGPKIGICAGGTIDFWTGKKRRAPALVQRLGMEWFWRLFCQPNRILRIWKAVVIFPLKALLLDNK
jgi:N-acetylglucosaminyldiphosphoundecaprenol N-acetyl-beta-D-mannosaminyltransferase